MRCLLLLVVGTQDLPGILSVFLLSIFSSLRQPPVDAFQITTPATPKVSLRRSTLLREGTTSLLDEDQYEINEPDDILVSYIWDLPSQDGDTVSDLLLELGAQSAQVVLASNNNNNNKKSHQIGQGITTTTVVSSSIDWDKLDPESQRAFDKTGKMTTESSSVIFSTRDDVTAQRLVQGVSNFMDWNNDSIKLWEDCRQLPTDASTASRCDDDDEAFGNDNDMTDAIEEKDYKIRIGNQELVISNSVGTSWAFGDGNHPSTRVMLAFGLEKYIRRGLSVLDYGCGSGILALCAKALGALNVTAVDISEEALEVTRLNAERNFDSDDGGNESPIQILHSDKYIPSADFDVVLANIPSNTCVRLLGILAHSMRTSTSGGVLLLSGYPASEADMVRKVALKDHSLDVVREFYDSGWVLQVLQRTE